MVIKKGTSRSSSISRIRHRTFVSPSLGSKLALVVSLTIFGFGIMAAGTGMGMPPICVIGGVIIFIALILQIFAWILFGRKLDNIEGASSANAERLQAIEERLAETNEILLSIYESGGETEESLEG